ncbi:hypothetical protein P4493_05090 [Bacillus thuringiensis]|jgi:hypothetical protein|uniref:Uncharacterized protein n=3 Tax=Bacillus thuringiensis TaxID=1428 RepID=A0A0B5N803_BACTU|nr:MULTISPECIES: hypothetical protein [Bacillus]EAO56433.1 hypothetical protein RBTH_07485 [Bacillus thuringiensis serovar israelensis ATCC 35646]MEC2535599.1 hypothetical protein [Bacillus cereus]MED1153630.1 hypothetical protein [Bacillus paranthracis]OUB09484.1 hypothetical protein BK708_33760 [Bacillus thuringiensis serovar yunnanensis]AFQ29955.1 hypothetical protein BTF1_29272 [Bacillus thuringiensis HD-789]
MASREQSYVILVTKDTDVKELEKNFPDIKQNADLLEDTVHLQRKDVVVNWEYYNQILETVNNYQETEEYKSIARVYTKLYHSTISRILHITFDLDLRRLGYEGCTTDFEEILNFILLENITLSTQIPLEGGETTEQVIVTSEQLQKYLMYTETYRKGSTSINLITELSGYKPEYKEGSKELDFSNAPKRLALPINHVTKNYVTFEGDKTLISFKLVTNGGVELFLNRLLTFTNTDYELEIVDLQKAFEKVHENDFVYFNLLCNEKAESDVIRLVLSLIRETINVSPLQETTIMSVLVQRGVDKEITSESSYYFVTGKGYTHVTKGEYHNMVDQYKEHLTQTNANLFGYATFM